MGDSNTTALIKKMAKFERRMIGKRGELWQQITHPMQDYQTPEQLDALYERMQQAKKFRWPSTFQVNV